MLVTAVGLLWAGEQGMAVGATAVADMWVVTWAALTAGGLVEVKADCGWPARLLAGVLTGAFIWLVVGAGTQGTVGLARPENVTVQSSRSLVSQAMLRSKAARRLNCSS